MAQIRTLKLNLLADTKGFSSGLKSATGQTETFSGLVGKSFKNVAKAAATAGAAVAGTAIAIGVESVKAAVEDQKSQTRLAKALTNVTGATKAQVAQVEKLIGKLQLQYGVSDSKLRPAYQRLIQSTKDYGKTQSLLNLALDVSAGTGKDVETVSTALAKAYDGNYLALRKLGVKLDEGKLKAEGFAYAQKQLAKTYGGQASAQAETFAGKWAIFNETIGEAKESIGVAILTGFQPLAEKWLPQISTGVGHFVDGLTGGDGNGGLKGAADDSQESLYNMGEDIRGVVEYLRDNKDFLLNMGKVIGSIFIGVKAYAAVNAMAAALGILRKAFARTTTVAATTAAAEAAATGGASLWAAVPAITAIASAFGVAGLLGMFDFGSPITGGGPAGPTNPTGVQGPGIVQPTTPPGPAGFRARTSSNFNSIVPDSGTTIINLNGIVDAESARRTIERLLQQSSVRTGAVNLVGGAL